MFENKRFQNNENGEIVKVVSESGMFYTLNNGTNIKKDIFLLRFSEMVDAGSFFNSASNLSEMASKITQIDPSKVSDIPVAPEVIDRSGGDGMITTAPSLNTKDEMIRKYYETSQKNQQYKVYENDDEAADDFFKKQQQNSVQSPQQRRRMIPEDGMDISNMDISGDYQQTTQPIQQKQLNGSGLSTMPESRISKEEESYKFFKSFKRIYPIKLTIDFEEKIADPSFIKMMVMNFEGDIIKYYTNELMNRVYNDPGFLENKIYNKLKDLIMGEEDSKKKTPRKSSSPKKSTTKPSLSTRTSKNKKEENSDG